MNRSLRYPPLFHTLLVCILLALLPFHSAQADDRAEARALASSGKLPEALRTADKYLAQHPNDPSMLFLKGMILTQQGQREKAITTLTRLTEKHPALPEPYNNLAALYAATGQYDKARATLEAGMRTHPAYANLYENLGAVYAKLASQAYDKALQTKAVSGTDQTRLALVHSLSTDAPSTKVQGMIVAVTPTAVEPTPVAPIKTEAPKTETQAPETSNTTVVRDAVVQTLDDWAAAWSNQDVKKYLGFYASDFRTPRGKSRKAWAEDRRARIVGKKRISVKVESPQITVSGNTATAKFKQAYSSDRLSVSSRKTIVFVKSNGEWKIRQEQSN